MNNLSGILKAESIVYLSIYVKFSCMCKNKTLKYVEFRIIGESLKKVSP